jgi:CheY-like chemotaxis protein
MADKTRRILVVEDSASILEFIRFYFTDILHWEVVAVNSGADALQAFEGGKFDMLLTDINLDAHMNGIEVARRLRQRQPTLAVVLMGGDHRASAMAKKADFGVFLHKPFDPPTLGKVCLALVESASGK